MAEALTLAVAGNPNSGKTTVFNGLTGSRQRIGNWPGVTVEKKEGTFVPGPVTRLLAQPFVGPHPGGTVSTVEETRGGREASASGYRVVDLPGIYSLGASSQDEAVARDYLLSADADVVVNVVDASNLQRNLFLTLQLLELGTPVIVVLNMIDAAAKKGITIDAADLGRHLGCAVIPTTAIQRQEIETLKTKIHDAVESIATPTTEISYGETMEDGISELLPRVEGLSAITKARPRWLALKILEGDDWVARRVVETSELSHDDIAGLCDRLANKLGEDLDVHIADCRYGFIRGLSKHISRRKLDRLTATERVDRVVMNRFLAIPVFFAVMYAVFWLTMSVGGAFIDFFDIAFGTLFVDGFGILLENLSLPGWLVGILSGGLGAGIQTVATFIPIIFIMFLALSALEDSGYMARAAYVMDRFMRSIGLPGKSFVPMMVGFGCTVPAIMGTRTLESPRDRFTTIFMAPFMSCGARLPVYALFAAAFFSGSTGLVVLSLYVVGIVFSVLTGLLLKLTLFRGQPSHFVMELPPYHAPRLRFVFLQAWQRLKLFLIRAGATITVIVTVLSFLNTVGTDGSIGNEDSADSVLAAIGKTVTPVFEPMGIREENWPATVGIFTGIFAKEAVVGTLSSLYGKSEQDAEEEWSLGGGLLAALATIPSNLATVFGGLQDPIGAGVVNDDPDAVAQEIGADLTVFGRLRDRFTRPGAYAYLLFILLYFPCVAALGSAMREMGIGLGWVLAGYTTILAWAVATLFYQLTTGAVLLYIAIPILLLAALIGGLALFGKTEFIRRRLGSVH